MAFNATAVGRVRTGGNAANGTFYDPGISGAGTDYTQQDAAQATWTSSLSMAGTSTLTDSGSNNLFTSAMIGNAVKVGSLFYFITAYTNANSVTVDRSDTFTNQSGRLGGAAADPWTIFNNSGATHSKVVPGNTIYIRGSGSRDPGSADYSRSGYQSPINGTSTNYVHLIGENGRPRLSADGLMMFGGTYIRYQSLYLDATGTSNASLGVIHIHDRCIVDDCKINLLNNAVVGIRAEQSGNRITRNEIIGHTTTPTASGGSYGLQLNGLGGLAEGNTICNCKSHGIYINAGVTVRKNLVKACAEDGIYINSIGNIDGSAVGNTVDANLGHGINVQSTVTLASGLIRNNLITNHTASGKVGLRIAAGTTAENDAIAHGCDYNRFYNNTSHYSGISAGANDATLSADPYTDDSTNDFEPNSTAGGGADVKGVGFPTELPGTNTASAEDIGASQAAAGGGGGGNTYSRGRLVNA